MVVHVGAAAPRVALIRAVEAPRLLPEHVQLVDVVQVEAGVAIRVCKGADDSAHRALQPSKPKLALCMLPWRWRCGVYVCTKWIYESG